MAITINANPRTDARLVNVTLNGLDSTKKYDVYRLQLRYAGENSSGNPIYFQEHPDRKKLWSSVAHRIGWTPSDPTVNFRDYGPLLRPFKYFVVESSAVGPYEFDWRHEDRDYPLSRGVLDDEVIHLNRLLLGEGTAHKGEILIRSSWELGLWTDACVFDIDELRYTARGNELPVLGREDPVYVADTREHRRGSLTLYTDRLGQYHDLRRIVFPQNGRIRPIGLHSGSDATMLLDDMICVPLDVQIEQATSADPDKRFIHIDFVEVDGTEPKAKLINDNDQWATIEPQATFAISDDTPGVGQWITLTDTSTGVFDDWDWTLSKGSNNTIGKFHGIGPHEIRFHSRGEKFIKLWVSGPSGADVKVKRVQVHG